MEVCKKLYAEDKRADCYFLMGLVFIPTHGYSQERRKIFISNATLSYSALSLVAAREWKLFQEQGLDVEIILMRSAAAAAALASGDLDYQSGTGPASVSATLSRFLDELTGSK